MSTTTPDPAQIHQINIRDEDLDDIIDALQWRARHFARLSRSSAYTHPLGDQAELASLGRRAASGQVEHLQSLAAALRRATSQVASDPAHGGGGQ